MENKEIKYAGFLPRIMGAVVDLYIFQFILIQVGTLITFDFVIWIILFFYFAFVPSKIGGTIGQRLFGLHVVDTDFNGVTLKYMILRTLLLLVASVWFYYVIRHWDEHFESSSLLELALPFLIAWIPQLWALFSKRNQTLFDLFSKTCVISTAKLIPKNIEEAKSKSGFIGIIRTLFMIVIGGFLAYGIFVFGALFFVYGGMAISNQKSYNASFHTHYTTKDFNDSRIIFYNKELEQYSKAFVSADGMYDIFAADTKRDLALNCIQASLKEHNVSEWIEKGSSFRKNARNKYTTTEEKIKKAKKNEDYMGQHFYDYDLNDVNHIEDELANIWDTSKNKNTCDKHLPASELFDAFMVRYIPTREEALSNNKREFEQAKTTGMLNKSFYKKKIEITTRWLNILHAKYPNIAQKIAELKIEKAKVVQKVREKKRKKALQRKIELTWLAAEKNNLYTGGYYKNVNLNLRNDKGQTPLMIAVENGFINVIQQFSKGKIDVALKDNQGKTAFDYLHRHTEMKKIKLFQALKLLEIKQIIKGKAKIINSVYRDDKVLQFSIKGASCNEFHFPKQTECFTPARVEIFRVIKSKDNRLFDELFSKVDIELKDKRDYSLLWRAILYHNFYAIDKILEAGADIYQTDNNDHHAPLFFAVMQNDTKLLELLIKHGVNVNSKNKFGNYALSESMFRCDNFEAIAMLLDNGANPYLKNRHGKTVFDKEAVFCKNKSNIVKMKQLLKERSTFSVE